MRKNAVDATRCGSNVLDGGLGNAHTVKQGLVNVQAQSKPRQTTLPAGKELFAVEEVTCSIESVRDVRNGVAFIGRSAVAGAKKLVLVCGLHLRAGLLVTLTDQSGGQATKLQTHLSASGWCLMWMGRAEGAKTEISREANCT